MRTKEVRAVISRTFNKATIIGFFACGFIAILFVVVGFLVIDQNLFIGILLFAYSFLSLPLSVFLSALINIRKAKLTSLIANEKEIVGSYTAFIPISKITLKMPIEKIDNIAAGKSIFNFFTGENLRIASTSGVIKIPFVANANEVVAFIYDAIEKAKNSSQTSAERGIPQVDVADSLKKFAELRDSGILTEEEFNQKKNELLGK